MVCEINNPAADNLYLASSSERPINPTGTVVFPGPSEIVSVTLLPAAASLVASGSWDATRSSGI